MSQKGTVLGGFPDIKDHNLGLLLTLKKYLGIFGNIKNYFWIFVHPKKYLGIFGKIYFNFWTP